MSERQPAYQPDYLMTRAEVAAWLRLSRDYLARLHGRGEGPRAFKISPGRSGTLRYLRGDVIAWLESRAIGGEGTSSSEGS